MKRDIVGMLMLLCIVIFSTFSTASFASEWEFVRQDNGIKVYRRSMENSDLLSFKGVGVVDAPIDVLLSVILDTRRTDEWTTNLKEAKVVKWVNYPTVFIQYDHIVTPWPLSDRLFVSQIKIDVNQKTYETRVTYSHTDYPMANKGRIRGELDGSYYILRPIDGGDKTLVIGVAVADPKGDVPTWLVNFYQRNWPLELIESLREQVAKPNINLLPRVKKLYQGFRVAKR